LKREKHAGVPQDEYVDPKSPLQTASTHTIQNGGHCQPVLFAYPHDPSIGHFELENFRTIRDLIEAKNIDCEFVVQPGVRTFYSRRLWNEVELAVLTCQETSPKLAELMTLVTDKDELAKLRVPTATGAVVTKIAARMWPYKFVARILEDLVMSSELKGSFNLQTFTPVESLNETGADGWIVNTPRGSIKAAKVVLATNAYTSHLMPNFADLIVPVRGQMSALEPCPSVAEKSRLKTSFGFDGEAIDEYLIQRPNERGGHLMYGGGRQIGGPTVGVADDSVFDAPIAEYLQQSLIDRLALPEGHKLREAIRTARCDFCKRSQVSICKHERQF
jgi:glycine/D-amino acid oxidase-like deaminating enzyme